MIRKTLAVMLAGLLFEAAPNAAAFADSKKGVQDKQAKFVEKLKTGIRTLGVGEKAVVAVKLKDKTKLAGYISEAGDESFSVTNPKEGRTTSIAYTDVAGVKGQNLSTGAKIAIGVGIGVAIALIVLAIYINCCTG